MSTPKAPAAADPALATQSWLSVVRAYHLCDAVLSERLAVLGLKLGEHEVLANLYREPGITQQQLAQRCFSAKSGVSVLVTRMEDDRLLRREADPLDARVRRLSLTARGEALAVKALAIQAEVVQGMVAGTSEADLVFIMEAMQRASVALVAMRSA